MEVALAAIDADDVAAHVPTYSCARASLSLAAPPLVVAVVEAAAATATNCDSTACARSLSASRGAHCGGKRGR